MADVIRPYVIKLTPEANSLDVSPTASIYIQFSERMKSSTLTTSTIELLKDPLESTDISLSYNDGLKLLTVTPSGTLDVETRYAIVVRSTVTDIAGNSMAQDYWANFWTEIPDDYEPTLLPQAQPSGYVLDGYLEVDSTDPTNYSTNVTDPSIVRIYFTDDIAIGNRNYLGDGTAPNPLMLGVGFMEEPTTTLDYYINVENSEVLGDPYQEHSAPTLSYEIKSKLVEIAMDNVHDNNEYIFTVRKGLPGLMTNPLTENYQFVFTSTYTPLYAGYNIVRLRIGPMLQMAMAYVPNDTLNRFIYEASKQAIRVHPTVFSSSNPPWYVIEYVIYQGTLNALYASLMIFAASGAGVRKQLADLMIEKDARGLMPAVTPVLNDLTKVRDEMLDLVKNGSTTTSATWARMGQYDPRRPINDNTWRRLPFMNYRDSYQDPSYQVVDDLTQYVDWIYTNELTGGVYY